jgi:hypothetical protein
MNHLPKILLLLLGLCSQLAAAIPERVLFVGNSYTYYENMTQVVAAFATSRDLAMQTRKATPGGATLEQHWTGVKGKQTLDSLSQIGTGSFDAVVLQEQSLRPITNPARMATFADKLCAAIKLAGGHPYLYLTWSRQQTPETQSKLTESYENVARETGATVAPVGLAWELARTRQPDLNLYSEDGSHPSSEGSYLAACVLFSTLTGELSAGLPFQPSATDANGEAISLMRVTKKDADFLQTIADEVMSTYAQPAQD